MADLHRIELDRALFDERLLEGGSLDRPRAGEVTSPDRLVIEGWVVGRAAEAVAVEAVVDGEVRVRAPLGRSRPDVASRFPGLPAAGRSGFRAELRLLPVAACRVELRAVLRDQRRAAIGTVKRTAPGGQDPLVSVVIPCYRQAHFLGEAIESVLAQTCRQVEVVVVDDGSPDNARQVAARYPGVRYLGQENRGLSAARNAGLEASRGPLLLFLDADDRLVPGGIEAGVNCLADHPAAAFAAGHYRVIDEGGVVVFQPPVDRSGGDAYTRLLRRNVIAAHPVVVYRRWLFEAVGGFDPSLEACEDYDLYLRAAARFPVCFHPTLVAEYRKHGSGKSRRGGVMCATIQAVLRGQRNRVRGDRTREAALREGIRFGREYFGGFLVDEVRGNLQDRAWRPALAGVIQLLRHHPRGLLKLARGW